MLDPIHHQGLRLALGAFRTSPTASLYVEADEPSLNTRREKLSLQYAIRIAENNSNPAHDVTFQPKYTDLYESKPNFIKSFGVRTLPVLESANINFKNIDKTFTPNIPTWCINKPKLIFDLHSGKKSETSPIIMKSNFQELKSHYIDYKHIYTDGSKDDMKVGCAVVSDDFSETMRIPDGSSIFTAEAKAIDLALDLIADCETSNCAPLVADLFLFCYERDFMLSLSDNNQSDVIEAFNSTSRYLDDLLNIDNPYFEQMVGQIYPTELQLNKANSSDTEAPFLDLNLSITNGIVSSKIYDKRDDFNFEIVNFPFLDGDVPRSPSYGVYISQLIRFARVCSNVDDFNNRNLFLTAKLLKQGYRYHKIRKAFSKFYHRHSELIVKYNIGLKTLLQRGISEPIFYGDLVYKFKRIVGKPNFSDQFKKIVKRYIRVGYNLDIMRQSACLVVNPITVYSYGFLFNCTSVGRASDSMTALT